jgi:amino acid permease
VTKQEFIKRQQTMTRGTNKRLGFWMAFFFAALFGCIPLMRYIERQEQDYTWIGAVAAAGLLVFLLGNLSLMVWYGARQQRQFGHRCPHCNKALVGFGVQLAIATGNCGHCGERVFSDHAA